MDKKKVALVLASLLCVNGCVFAAQGQRSQAQGSVRSALTKTDNPYSPYYGEQGKSLKARLEEKRAVRKAPERKAPVEEEVQKKGIKVKAPEKIKPFAGAEPLNPVQRKILAYKGRYSDPANPTGYYLDGDKIAYPDSTRIIKHREGNPVKIFMQANRITDIFLKSDEHIEDIVVDNKFGLRIGKTYESGRYARWHISVTPVDNNPGTEMYVRTDKRSYHFYLEPTSDGKGYVPYVRFAYLEDHNVKPSEESIKAQQEAVKKEAERKAKAEKLAAEKADVKMKPVKNKSLQKVSDRLTKEEKLKQNTLKKSAGTQKAQQVNKAKAVKSARPSAKGVGYGSKSAGGSSEGLELYWSN